MKKVMIYLLLLLCMAAVAANAETGNAEPEYFLFQQNGLFGYADRTGNIVIPAQWNYAEQFENGIALVSNDEESFSSSKDGLIDSSGDYILKPDYLIERTPGSLYIVAADCGECLRYGYYDAAARYCQQPVYDAVQNRQAYPNGLVSAQKDGKWGFLRKKDGSIAIPFLYDEIIEDFSNGFALVCRELPAPNAAGFLDQYLLINEEGNNVQFCQDVMPVSTPSKDGNVIICGLPQDRSQKDIWGGDAVYGIGKTDGSILLTPSMAYIMPFSGDYAAFVDQSRNWGMLDTSGKIRVPPTIRIRNTGFFEPLLLVNGYAVYETEESQWKAVDSCGNVISLEYENQDVSAGQVIAGSQLIPFMTNDGASGCYGLWKTDGHLVMAPCIEDYSMFSCGLCRVQVSGRYGFMNEEGNVVIPCIYEAAGDFSHDIAYVIKDGHCAFITLSGDSVMIHE